MTERQERLIEAPGKWYDGLSTRVKHCIMNALHTHWPEGFSYEEYVATIVPSPKVVAEKGRKFWLGEPNCGKKSVALIEQWLNKHGYEWESERVLKQERGEQHAVTREIVAGRWHYFCTVCDRSLDPDSPWREDCPGA